MQKKVKPQQRSRKLSNKPKLTQQQQRKAELQAAEHQQSSPDLFELPKSERTIHDLTDYFARVNKSTIKILPKEKRRYAVYLRKSTDDESKQVRSLEDQRTECLALADSQGITIDEDDIHVESASAKISGNRPIFDAMLLDFKRGKYHGLIAWSPDRLSRNMKEAGEVIEMIDHEQIQDLQFRTYQFENSPNGKMLLGILFATSKQYSDKLAVDVKRGSDGNIKEGRYNGVAKKGYYVDATNGYFTPDGHNWTLLRKAVVMCLYEGKTRVDAVKFLNDAHFGARKSQDDEIALVKMTKQMLGHMFSDPFYFGVYQYGDNIANLTELYSFLPLMTPDEHITLNKEVAGSFSATSAKTTTSRKLTYGLLRGKVICDYCDQSMQFQHQQIKRGVNSGKWLISFYCRNSACERHSNPKLKKSIRAKYVMAAIEYHLRLCTKRSIAAYRQYIDMLSARIAQDTAIAKRKLKEARDQLRHNEVQYAKYQDFQVTNPADYKKHHKGKLEEYEALVEASKHAIRESEQALDELSKALPTEDEFYELTNSHLLKLLKTTDLMEQDAICNEVVSNLRAGNDIIPVIKLNPPYDLLVDLAKVSTGRG